ncbi:MAG: 2OG-Fe(II) oxygenase [Pseudohongiellaceae bacterium]
MNAIPQLPLPADNPLMARAAAEIRRQGWCRLPDALPPELAQSLLLRAVKLRSTSFRRAGVGRHGDELINDFVRRDKIHWLDGRSPEQAAWLQWAEQSRAQLNRELFLGLFSFESHFAHYPVGGFYRKHLDAFKGEANRKLSVVLYLNPGWTTHDGGELVLYSPDIGAEEVARVTPLFGTLVMFLSEEFPHEVLPAHRDRYSIAGWFRINASHPERSDPPR